MSYKDSNNRGAITARKLVESLFVECGGVYDSLGRFNTWYICTCTCASIARGQIRPQQGKDNTTTTAR